VPEDETLPSGLRVVASSFVESDWKEGQGIREQYVVEARTTRLGILPDAPAAVVHVTYERNVGAAYAELIGPLRPSEVASWVAAAAAVRSRGKGVASAHRRAASTVGRTPPGRGIR
jgi:hypothetical protein